MRFPTLFPLGLWVRLVARHGVSWGRVPNALALPIKWALVWPFHVADRLLYSKRIREAQVRSPVFIVGQFRSGTTYLHRLLSSVAPMAAPNAYQVIFCEAFLSSEWLLKPLLQRVSNLLGLQNPLEGVPLDWDNPGEDDVALFMAPYEASANWGIVFPKASPAGFSDEAYFDGWTWFVRKLSVRYPGATLVLKNPPGTLRMEALAERFPDSRFVYLYRDPVELFSSMRRFWEAVGGSALHVLTPAEVDDRIVASVRAYHAAFLRSRERLPASRWIVVRYEDLDRDPSAALAAIWERLGAGPFPKAAFEVRIADQGKRGKRPLTLTEDVRARVRRDLPEVLAFWEASRSDTRSG